MARPDPDAGPDPLPEAEADPDAEALPQLYGSYMPTMAVNQQIPQGLQMPMDVPYDVPYDGLGVGQCSTMVDQCCGMADQGCSMQCSNQGSTTTTTTTGQSGQQCYTKYVRKCRYSNKPVCQTMSKTKCYDHAIKECRYTQEKQYVDVPVNECKLINEKKCFKYDGVECASKGNTYSHNFTWVNEEKEPEADEQIEKCHSIKSCKVTTKMETRIQKIPKQECEKISQPRKVCNSIAVPQPPQVISYTDYRTDYKQQCYRIPKPVCRQVPCQYHVVSQNICPLQSSCPTNNFGGGPCPTSSCDQMTGGTMVGGMNGAISLPEAVGGIDICGACRTQNVQMCQKTVQKCDMEYETVCQQVPYKVPVPGTRTIPSPPKYTMKCHIVNDMIDQCKTVYIDKTVEVPVQSCKNGVEEKCFKYSVPQHKVVTQPANEIVKFETRECDVATVEREHCAMLNTRMDCQKRTVPRAVLIRKKVCDRTKMARYCNTIPFSQCVNNPGQECTMEPTQVCVPTSSCPQNDYCNQCTQFVNSGGYNQCSTPTCPNYFTPPGNCPTGVCY